MPTLFLWGRTFICIVDECIRYKFTDELKDRSYEFIQYCSQKAWLRYFGPSRVFLCDQEGAYAGDPFAHVCDKLKIDRWLAGSDPGHLGRGGKRTSAGIVESALT